jgi:hypothetical protein
MIIFKWLLQGNGPVCQVETMPEILRVYRAYLLMTTHKILVADTQCKGAKFAQSWNEQFRFAPLLTRVTAARLAVELFSPVHSNGVSGARH